MKHHSVFHTNLSFSRVVLIWLVLCFKLVANTNLSVPIRIGAISYPPYGEFTKGIASGFAFDIIRAAFDTQGYRVEFIEYPFARLMKNGHLENLDAFQMDLTAYPTNLRNYVYAASPYFFTYLSIFSKKSVIPHQPEFGPHQIYKGKTVGIVNSANLSGTLNILKTMGLNIELSNDSIGVRKMFSADRIQFLYAAEPAVLAWMKKAGYKTSNLNISRHRKTNAHLVFNKKRKNFRKLSDAFMEGMTAINLTKSAKNGGESLMLEIVSKYFGENSSLFRFWPKEFYKGRWIE